MANVILIMGNSGTGKSRSIKTLDPKTTLVINPLKKRLPFKGADKLYNIAEKNYFEPAAAMLYQHTQKMLEKVNKDESMAHIKTIVIDDGTYYMRNEVFATANIKGYEKYSTMAANLQKFLQSIMELRQDLNVFLIWHPETSITGDSIIYQPSLSGKMIAEKYNPLEVVTICLFADIKYEQEGAKYVFYTNRTMIGTTEVPAKSPEDMFEDVEIPNDMQYVIEKINAYYE